MLTLGSDSCCDVCLEDYSPARVPFVYPCGHVTCQSCCDGLLAETTRRPLCPQCRAPFARDTVHKLRIDFSAGRSAAPAAARAAVERHEHIGCDICRITPIEGDRYNCADCRDWDACANCFAVLPASHRAIHSFIRIRSNDDFLHKTRAEAPATGGIPNMPSRLAVRLSPGPGHIYCDVCRHVITGNRVKCVDCPNWDACPTCFRVLPATHKDRHRFVHNPQRGAGGTSHVYEVY